VRVPLSTCDFPGVPARLCTRCALGVHGRSWLGAGMGRGGLQLVRMAGRADSPGSAWRSGPAAGVHGPRQRDRSHPSPRYIPSGGDVARRGAWAVPGCRAASRGCAWPQVRVLSRSQKTWLGTCPQVVVITTLTSAFAPGPSWRAGHGRHRFRSVGDTLVGAADASRQSHGQPDQGPILGDGEVAGAGPGYRQCRSPCGIARSANTRSPPIRTTACRTNQPSHASYTLTANAG
jgi:hypothetical protein